MRHLAVAIALLCAAATLRAQVITNPNQIQGTFELTNTNPEVLSYLGAPANLGLFSLHVWAQAPGGLSASTWGVVDTRLRGHFELTVETSSPGLRYSVTPDTHLAQGGFPVPPQMSGSVFPEPAPDVAIAFTACAGILRVHFRDAAGAACLVQGGSVVATNSEGASTGLVTSGSDAIVALRGSTWPFTIEVRWTTGSDPAHDLIHHVLTLPQSVTVGCDEVVDVDVDCASCAGSGSAGLGRIVGIVDVLGEDEHDGCATRVEAMNGPEGNERYECLTGTPASGPFELENLLPTVPGAPGGWTVNAGVAFNHAGAEESLAWFPKLVTVLAGQTTDVGNLFVMTPGYVHDRIRLIGPPSRDLGLESFLADLSAPAPTPPFTVSAMGTGTLAPGETMSSAGISTHVEGSGTYDAGAETFDGTAELVTGGWFGEPSVHAVKGGVFSFRRAASDADPDRHHEESLVIDDEDQLRVLVTPGVTTELASARCMGEVRIAAHSTGAPLYAPQLFFQGSLYGLDFEGRLASLYMNGLATGTPRLVAGASVDGQVLLALPAGRYRIYPSANFVNPGGGTSQASFRSFALDVGCRQSIGATPELQVSVASPPSCAADIIRIAGVAHSTTGVAAITWQVDSGSQTSICTSCGANPAFSVDVPLHDTDAEIVVRATDVNGRQATSRSFTRFAREPSAGDIRPGATPLTVARAAGGLRLAWEDVGATVNVYRGTLESLRDGRRYDHHDVGACNLATTTTTLAMPSENSYFVVGGHCDWGDTALGRDSSGRPIAGAYPRCE